jgi:chromosome segregation ATPase
MDKPTIQAAVWHAADQLFAEGIRPTVANIREITKRGSAGTINQALKDWWHDLSRRVSSNERRPEVPKPVADAMCQLWSASLDRAEHALHAHRENAERQANDAKALQAAAEKRSEQAEQRSRMLEQQLEALRLANADLQRALAAQTALRRDSESRIRLVKEEAGKAASDMQASIVRMEKQIELEKERYRSMECNLIAQADENRAMRRQAEQRLAELQAACSDAEAAYRAEVLDYKERSVRQSERCALLEQRIAALESELKQAAQHIHALLNENTVLKNLPSRTLIAARSLPRLKAWRMKKRRL